jgi:hypothetical protein
MYTYTWILRKIGLWQGVDVEVHHFEIRKNS